MYTLMAIITTQFTLVSLCTGKPRKQVKDSSIESGIRNRMSMDIKFSTYIPWVFDLIVKDTFDHLTFS